MLLLTPLAYTRPFISSRGVLNVTSGKSSRNFIHPFLILSVVARSAPPTPLIISQIIKTTHPYTCPSTTRSSARSAYWIVPSHRLQLKPAAIRDKSPSTPLHHFDSTMYILCTYRVYLHSFPTDITVLVSSIAINHYFRFACNHLQSFVNKDNFPFSHTFTDAPLLVP